MSRSSNDTQIGGGFRTTTAKPTDGFPNPSIHRPMTNPFLILLTLALTTQTVAAATPPLLNDHQITIHTQAQAHQKRQALLKYLWGSAGLPTSRPKVTPNIPSPVKQLTHLQRVDELKIDL